MKPCLCVELSSIDLKDRYSCQASLLVLMKSVAFLLRLTTRIAVRKIHNRHDQLTYPKYKLPPRPTLNIIASHPASNAISNLAPPPPHNELPLVLFPR